ncbi:hypothetical protein WL40_10775 [Burkholderia ubonensis]|uniref:DUF7940 domain-containing protein n=1 Tax=Burkholderia ubonensis TaxID=101571 RepID=UPI00075477DE|nr:hypothetical protein [Burkholderia ubonensis]KWB72612.1 hypothetical protein WL40_10775 [Burkholderia ubonensis]
MSFKITLASDWRRLHRVGSVILSCALAVMSALSPLIRETWHNLPDDLKAVMPAHVHQAIAYVVLFGTICAARYASFQRHGEDRA